MNKNPIKLSDDCFLFRGGYLNNNSIVIISKENIFIIDPSYNFLIIQDFLKDNKLKKIIIYTHAHSDHIGCDINAVFKYADNVLFSENVKELIDKNYHTNLFFGPNNVINKEELNKVIYIKHNQELNDFKFFYTPGHSIDSMCIVYKNYFIAGDLVFSDSIGRTDFPYSNPELMKESLILVREIFKQNPNYSIIPGHDECIEAKNILKAYFLSDNFIAKFS